MISNFELQQLRDLPIEEVAGRLGLQVARHKALCPFHDDRHPSLSFHTRRNTYRCFVCDAHGGTIDLVMRMLHLDFPDACRWLDPSLMTQPPLSRGVKGLPVAVPIAKRRIRPGCVAPSNQPQPSFDASRYERFFLNPTLSQTAREFLFSERRLDPRVVRWCRLTSWRDRNGIEWLQIPYYSSDGLLIGIQNRNLTKGAQPRFRFPTGSVCSIYNLPVLNRLKPREPLYITEGASDCWAMLSAGHKAVAIPSATLLSKKDKEILETLNLKLETQFHMFPDRDLPGERLFLQLQQVLPNLQHHQLPPDCKDFSDLYLQNQSLTFNL